MNEYVVTYTVSHHVLIRASTPERARTRAITVLKGGYEDREVEVLAVEVIPHVQ